MIKNEFNKKIREYVRKEISPTESDRKFISEIYQSFKELLGTHNILQIGSYPRYTAIRPLHDLDILYILGSWNGQSPNPEESLKAILDKIGKDYVPPRNCSIKKSLQTHSVNVIFKDEHDKTIFSVDIVPAYTFSSNEFQQDTYMVPEITRKKHRRRVEFYEKLSNESKEMKWIHTDPRGYIKIAEQTDQLNNDFRKTVKFIKAWKNSCKEKCHDFKLKSFHIEQVVIEQFQQNSSLEIFDSIFVFFTEIPQIIKSPRIKDRVGNGKYIDEYLAGLTGTQKNKLIQARDGFLRKLENFSADDPISDLIKADFYKRNKTEKFLFDDNIPILVEGSGLKINGRIIEKPGFRSYVLNNRCYVEKHRTIKFEITTDVKRDSIYWKVQNDKTSNEVLKAHAIRGEITGNHSSYHKESTRYSGHHYVECFAIKNNICIARSKVNVNII